MDSCPGYKALVLAFLAAASCSGGQSVTDSGLIDGSTLSGPLRQFQNPPNDSRMILYWWWFGPSQTEAQMSLELEAMKKAGIGGVFIFPVYPLSPRAEENYPYLSPRYLEVLRYALLRARELSMTVDLLLGGGWPFGGPGVELERSSRTIQKVSKGKPLEAGEELLAVDQDAGTAFVSSPTRQRLKAGPIGCEGWVLDHLDRNEVLKYLDRVGAPQVSALPPGLLRSVNYDSLEAFGQGWTPGFLEEFQRRRGYDLKPHLAALFDDRGPETPHVRHDYWQTVADLALDHFARPLREWSREHGVRLQGKPMGQPVMDLRCHAEVDLTMAEEYDWLGFSGPRWAASGAHVYGQTLVANEGYTWLRQPRYLTTLQDVKVGSDIQFLAGVNVIVGHGFSYSPDASGVPGWSYYAGTYFNPKNPWWGHFPRLADYVHRVSFILRQGVPVADIALYLPEDDAMARAPAGRLMGFQKVMVKSVLGPDVPQFGLESALRDRSPIVSTIVTHGYSFDGINNDALAKAAIVGGRLQVGHGSYRVLVLPEIEGMPLESIRKAHAFARSGGTVIAVGRTPSRSYGLARGAEESAQTLAEADALFSRNGPGTVARDADGALLDALGKSVPPDLGLEPHDPNVGFVHRRVGSQDFYFVANTSPAPKRFAATFRATGRLLWCDPMNGTLREAAVSSYAADGTKVPLVLGPFHSIVVAFDGSSAPRASAAEPPAPSSPPLPVSGPWDLRILDRKETLNSLRSWTEIDAFKHFSGTGVYAARLDLPRSLVARGSRLILSMGKVREIAEVTLNGRTAGVAWMEPYEVDLTGLAREGPNELEIKVTNLLINRVLGQPDPDVGELVAKYGYLFPGGDIKFAQNLERSKVKSPLPSGLLGPVELRFAAK